MLKLIRYTAKSLLLLIPMYILGCWWLARLMTNSLNEPVYYSNYFPNEKVQDWNLKAKDGQQISAWFIPKDSSKVVILLAGKGGDRRGMITRAHIYLMEGYSVLLPDLRGTGNSKAPYVTIGYNERYDLLACVDTLQKLHYKHIAVHGHSLGAATIAYSMKDFSGYSFAVLESCYDNIDHAFEHRMDKLHLPVWLMYPVKKFAEMRLGLNTKELYPENYINRMRFPVLFMCGDREWQIPLTESKKLFYCCSSPKKYLHVFKGASHEDFLHYAPQEYKNELSKIIR